jgi:hypothetical protein
MPSEKSIVLLSGGWFLLPIVFCKEPIAVVAPVPLGRQPTSPAWRSSRCVGAGKQIKGGVAAVHTALVVSGLAAGAATHRHVALLLRHHCTHADPVRDGKIVPTSVLIVKTVFTALRDWALLLWLGAGTPVGAQVRPQGLFAGQPDLADLDPLQLACAQQAPDIAGRQLALVRCIRHGDELCCRCFRKR